MHFSNIYKQECIPVGCLPSAAVGVCWGGVVCLGGVCLGGSGCPGDVCPRGCLPGGCLPGGVCPGDCLPEGVSAWRAVCLGGVCPGVSVLMVSGRQPPMDRILTHACENITFPQLHLWTVIISLNQFHLPFKSHAKPLNFLSLFSTLITKTKKRSLNVRKLSAYYCNKFNIQNRCGIVFDDSKSLDFNQQFHQILKYLNNDATFEPWSLHQYLT